MGTIANYVANVHVGEYMEAAIYYRCMQLCTCEFSMLRKWTVQRHASYGVITIMLVPVQWVYVSIATHLVGPPLCWHCPLLHWSRVGSK